MRRSEPEPLSTASEQIAAYTLLALIYFVLGVAYTAAPGWCLSTALGVTPTPLATALFTLYGSTFAVALGAAVSLKGAAEQAHLASDTYKRLNLGLMYWAVVTVVLQVRSLAITTTPLLIGYAIVGGLTVAAAARIYALTNTAGFDIRAVARGLVAGVSDCLRPRNMAATLYAVIAIDSLVSFAALFAAPGMQLLGVASLTPLEDYLKRKLATGFVLTGVVAYVLKDGADRDRLSASTFRILNVALATTLVVMGGMFVYLNKTLPGVDTTTLGTQIVFHIFAAGGCIANWVTNPPKK